MQLPKWFEIRLKLLAFEALPEIERRGLDYLQQHGTKLVDKRQMAIDFIMARYSQFTAVIPGLNLTTIDDDLVRAKAGEAIDEAWKKLGTTLNKLSRQPITDDATLPKGGPK